MADDGISSANTVGYTSKSISADTYYLIGVQFQKVGENGVAGLNDILKMSGVTAVPYDEQEDNGARIDVLVGSAYISYYYISDAYDADGNEVTGWAKDGDLITTADLALGNGFWFVTKNASAGATLTVAGEVTAASEFGISFPGSKAFAIKSNPFPTAANLADVTTTGITAVPYDQQEDSAARIDVLVGSAYVSYYYISDAYDADGNEVTGWAKDGDLAEPGAIPVGASFWINSPTAGTITFNK